jgi:hypothetical protein
LIADWGCERCRVRKSVGHNKYVLRELLWSTNEEIPRLVLNQAL